MRQIKLQQGDTFSINFQIKSNGELQDLDNDETIAIGFYDEYGYGKVFKLNEKDGIQYTGNKGIYTLFVPNELTRHFIGNVSVELVVYSNGKGEVSHSNNIIQLFFEERIINKDI